jgi:hypothetical protein
MTIAELEAIAEEQRHKLLHAAELKAQVTHAQLIQHGLVAGDRSQREYTLRINADEAWLVRDTTTTYPPGGDNRAYNAMLVRLYAALSPIVTQVIADYVADLEGRYSTLLAEAIGQPGAVTDARALRKVEIRDKDEQPVAKRHSYSNREKQPIEAD